MIYERLISVEDSSGRYTNSFFWGNSFFVGSATECNFIGMDYSKGNQLLTTSPNEVREFTAEPKKKKNHGLSGDMLLTPTISDAPPFKIGFYMMKININGTVGPTVHKFKFRTSFNITGYILYFNFD